MQVAESDTREIEILEQGGDAGALALRVVGVDDFATAGGKRQSMRRKGLRYRLEPFLQVKRQLFLAELAHELGLVLDQNDFPLVHHPDAVGHLFGFVNVMGRQDDGYTFSTQCAHDVPHVLAQLDVDARRRFVEKKDLRLVHQAKADVEPPFLSA